MAIDFGVPLITDIKCAKLLVTALYNLNKKAPKLQSHIDCLSSERLVRIPGLIDTHVHLRDPGQTHKEDFGTGTSAALAGGITLVCAMPNTNPAIIDEKTLALAEEKAEKAHTDFALYLGATPFNAEDAASIAHRAAGLKIYMNDTFSTLKMSNKTHWIPHFDNWPRNVGPICVHAEGETTANAILMAKGRPLHICHVARKSELEVIKAAKDMDLPITCEVCPHHLFLTLDELEGQIGPDKSQVRPCLVTKEDQQYLWDNMEYIDTIGSDHAPHTLEEKETHKYPGFPGLETMLPLMLTAVNEGRLTLEDLVDKMYNNPRKIFNLPEQPDTFVEINMKEVWTIPEKTAFSKAGWTPFAGRSVTGKIKRVVLRGKVVYVDGQVLSEPGYGQNVRQWPVVSSKTSKRVRDTSNNADLPRSRKPSGHQPLVQPTLDLDGTQTLKLVTCPSFYNQHILEVSMFTKEMLYDLFRNATYFKNAVARSIPIDHILKGKHMAKVFYEPSTRTSASFEAAMHRLGGTVTSIDETSSSAKKGESLEDSVACVSSYVDLVVLRHPGKGAVAEAAKKSLKPIINAGDGIGEHPTQALLDVFTIR